ncbi:MAG: radical SAM protein [bacterium]
MKICFINPPWITKSSNIWTKIRGTLPPLGLLYLSSFLEKEGITADIIDYQVGLHTWEEIGNGLKQKHYDFYGITGTTSIINNSYRIAEIIKACHPDAKIVMGGVHVTALPEEALEKKSVDFVIRGDGEKTLLDLVTGCPVDGITGLSYTRGGEIIHVGPNGMMPDLDAIPFPAFHRIDLKSYRPALNAYRRLPAINMMTTRGCPGKCTFCNSADIPLRCRSAENIYAEMKMLSEKHGIKEISFYDDTFTVFHENINRLCDLLIAGKIDLTWSCFARVDTVTLPLLKKMKTAGCHQVMFGIESASPEILRNIGKNIEFKKNSNAVKLAKEAGITARCTFMFGNPGETEQTIDETIRYSLELDPDIALYNITTPYPGTAMFNWAKESGCLLHENWDDYDLSEPVMQLPTISAEKLKLKYKEAFRIFYFRPAIILKNMAAIATLKNVYMVRDLFRRFFESS